MLKNFENTNFYIIYRTVAAIKLLQFSFPSSGKPLHLLQQGKHAWTYCSLYVTHMKDDFYPVLGRQGRPHVYLF